MILHVHCMHSSDTSPIPIYMHVTEIIIFYCRHKRRYSRSRSRSRERYSRFIILNQLIFLIIFLPPPSVRRESREQSRERSRRRQRRSLSREGRERSTSRERNSKRHRSPRHRRRRSRSLSRYSYYLTTFTVDMCDTIIVCCLFSSS